jgi:5'-3' exonuclease
VTQLLIDGDEYLFKACAAVEREVRWDEFNHVLYCNRNEAWDNHTRLISQLFERFDTSDHLLCFSGEQPYFRHAISTDYKPGRSRKPLCYTELRELCDEKWNTISYPHLEADDVMGILARPGRIVISQDKDMKGVPCDLSQDGGELEHVTPSDADYWHMFQTLVGDRVDGYSGCPGVGPVKAEAILQRWKQNFPGDHAALWTMIVHHFEKRGLTEADALVQARLARILRSSDWDKNKKEPILWSPGSP